LGPDAGLGDGYFVLPYTIQNYLADDIRTPRMTCDEKEFVDAEEESQNRLNKLLSIKGKRSVDSLHKELGLIMWDFVGMVRNKEGLQQAIEKIRAVRKEFWSNVRIPGSRDGMNIELEKANRLADFIEIAELMATDALDREESCGGHFREEHQTEEGEALRHDDKYAYVSCWEYQGEGKAPAKNVETLNYEAIELVQRNYK
jgi:succinate dehydrogenase / fumarate reductase flavoprotein subunit